MCELFGVCGKTQIQLNGYLQEFFSHSVLHPHGWGMVNLETGEMKKEPVPAYQSRLIPELLKSEIKSASFLAHIRQATQGSTQLENCHPFVGQDHSGRVWTLSHNGTIFSYSAMDPYREVQVGATDSERILYYLLDLMNAKMEETKAPLTEQERFCLMDELLCHITVPNNKVNLMVYDGEFLYVHTNMAGTLYQKKQGDTMIFATQPLDREEWVSQPFTTLLVYRKGEVVFTGTNHGHEYRELAAQ